MDPMKIHFLLDGQVRHQPNPVLASAMAMLGDRGFAVSSGIPEETLLCPDRLCARHDLYVLQSQTELALSVAGVLHDRGASFVDSYAACTLAHNRIIAASRLAAAGLPVPHSWVTTDFGRLCELAAEQPVIVKPHRTARGTASVVAYSAEDLVGIRLAEQPMLVQQFIEGAEAHLALAVIGEQVFARRTRLGRDGSHGPAEGVSVSARIRDLALRCGRAFGLGLFGVDIVEGPHGPVVVDLHHAPCFDGLAAAGPVLAAHIEDVARGRTPVPRHPPTLHVTPAWAGFMQEITV